MNYNRDLVLLIGDEWSDPEIVAELHKRDLAINAVQWDEIPKYVSRARAIMCRYTPKCSREIQTMVSNYRLLSHGLLILIVHSDLESISAQAEFSVMKAGSRERVKLISDREAHQVAQLVVRHDSEPPENDLLQVVGAHNEECELLVRRAFYDCVSVRLEPLGGGFAAQTYRAEVMMKGLEGPAPLPYFVKYDEYERIEQEKLNYQRFAENYLPFNHRPNLIHKRCIRGESHDIIVGNFVEHSTSIGALAWKGNGTVNSAIHSLFKGALRGWRQQAFHTPHVEFSTEQRSTILQSLTLESDHNIFRETVQEETEFLAHQLGLKMTYRDLVATVRNFPPVKHLRGVIHCDLHTNNLHVHGLDAILLDFYSVTTGPLLWDPALLDASLMFDAWDAPKKITDEEWMRSASEIYSVSAVDFPLRPERRAAFKGTWDAIEEIRLYAKGLERDNRTYMQTLIIALLRLSSFQTTDEHLRFRKAFGLCIAETLTETIVGE